jgi:glycosyltransferase involved in cell wall biosynthesis
MSTRGLAVIIPTYNSERTIRNCLASIARQMEKPAETVVVDDVRTTDRTRKIAECYGARVIVSAAGRAESRNVGVAATRCDYILSLDSDMILSEDLVLTILTQFKRGASGLIIPEIGIGEGYWARARAIDKAAVEHTRFGVALRAFTRATFDSVGGFDETLLAGEDLDFHERVVRSGASMRHLKTTYIKHDEGRLRLREAIRKKYWYGLTLPKFESKHGSQILIRGFPARLMRGIRVGLRDDPRAVPGFIVLKGAEAIAGFSGRFVAQRGRASSGHIR